MKKRNIFIVVGVCLVVVVILVVFFMRRGNQDFGQGPADNQMGIFYGGTFDEFEYRASEEQDETESIEDISEIEAELERIDQEFQKSIEKDLLVQEEENQVTNTIKTADSTKDVGSEELLPESSVSETMATDEEAPDEEDTITSDFGFGVGKVEGYAENEVLCDALSMEEAEAVAAQIAGTVIYCEQGTAKIRIQENVDVLLERLEREGSELELYRSYIVSIP